MLLPLWALLAAALVGIVGPVSGGYLYEAPPVEPCPPGAYRRGAECLLCPAGTFGLEDGLTSPRCSGVCSPGHFCVAGSTNPRQEPCPAGRYGSMGGAETAACTGACSPGHFCVLGSTTSTQNRCGGSNYYCPTGSGHRIQVTRGWYTVDAPGLGPLAVDGGVALDISNMTRAAQVICEPGSYCDGRGGVKQPCPPGTYGSAEGLWSANCTARCPAGYFCPEGSVVPTICPAGRYGAVEGLSMPECTGECAAGFYCPAGSTRAEQAPCPAGLYGAAEGLGALGECHSACRGGVCEASTCAAGYFCPERSDSATERECGGADRYCPAGSAVPTPVALGYYTVGETVTDDGSDDDATNMTRSGQRQCEPGSFCVGGVKEPCPPGRYGAAFGLSTRACSGPCRGGYTCPEGSPHADEVMCGEPAFFCPEASGVRTPVAVGHYTTGGAAHARANQTLCAPTGHWCSGGIRRPCPPGRYGATLGLSGESCTAACPLAHFCPEGSPLPTPCPAGTFGATEGLTSPACSGQCSPGFYCPEASASPRQEECGGEHVFCPVGSGTPTPVRVGFYATGGGVTTRHAEEFCDVDTAFNMRCPDTTITGDGG